MSNSKNTMLTRRLLKVTGTVAAPTVARGGETTQRQLSIQPRRRDHMSENVKRFYEKCRESLRGETGQGLVEYALILVLIAIVVIAAIKGIGAQANSTFSTINSGLH
jgi:pilus assembly protein Flp/PilA